MSSTAAPSAVVVSPADRVEVFFEELAELALGLSSGTAHTIATVARRLEQFPRCAQGLREGRLSLDQVGSLPSAPAQDPMSTMRRWPQ